MISPHKINSLDNFISGYYHEDTSFCDSIVSYYNSEKCNDKRVGPVFIGEEGLIIDDEFKISYEANLDKNDELIFSYFSNLKTCIDDYVKKYEFAEKQGEFKPVSATKIQYYPIGGGFFKWHCERAASKDIQYLTRHLVYMTYLNDVDDGGETEFFYQKLKVKPEKGLTLIWPADWTFTHRGNKNNQDKYVVTGWLNLI